MKKLVFTLLLIFASASGAGVLTPLTAEQAFKLQQVNIIDGKIITSWQVAKDYYLYKERFKFDLLKSSQLEITQVIFPTNFVEKDYPDGSKMHAFSGDFKIILILSDKNHVAPVKLHISYQGCSSQGICYPQQSQTISSKGINVSEQARLVHFLEAKNTYLTLLIFLGLGILLSLTPCVLPMLPALSAILLGQKTVTQKRSFLITLCYVLSIATSFAVLGVIAGTIGKNIQTALQKPWVIIGFSLIFVIMALSLFDFYAIAIPNRIRQYANRINRQQQGGTYVAAMVMGALSVLIASPCITPPLAAAILYLAGQGSIFISASALFAMGLGIGLPLLVIGLTSPKLLPKAGNWMNGIKYFFGFLLLAVAIWMLNRVLPPNIIMILWAALAVGAAITLRAFNSSKTRKQHILKALGILLFIYSIVLFIGALLGNTDPLRPLARKNLSVDNKTSLPFVVITSLPELQIELKKAQQRQQPVMLDFYANWCITCHEMETYLFSNPEVKKALQGFYLIRADVTENSEANQNLQRHFQVIAPPTLLFFNRQGNLSHNARIVGKVSVKNFLNNLENNAL